MGIQEMNEVALKEWEQKNNEIDNKLIEIKETNKKCKEIESELKRVNVEKDEILKEKESIKDKLADYVELQYQFRANEKEYESKIKKLNQKNLKQNNQINVLKGSVLKSWNTLKTLKMI